MVCAEVGSAEVFFMCRQSSKEIQLSLEMPLSKISGKGNNNYALLWIKKSLAFSQTAIPQRTHFRSEQTQFANKLCHAFGFMYEFEKFPDFS